MGGFDCVFRELLSGIFMNFNACNSMQCLILCMPRASCFRGSGRHCEPAGGRGHDHCSGLGGCSRGLCWRGSHCRHHQTTLWIRQLQTNPTPPPYHPLLTPISDPFSPSPYPKPPSWARLPATKGLKIIIVGKIIGNK